MRNGLMAFYQANKGKGAPLIANKVGNETTIEVIGPLAADDDVAEWLGAVSMASLARMLRALTAEDVVHLRIHSPGGDVFAGVMAAGAIRETAARVVAHIDGYAASAASLLVAAADEAIIAPGGKVMIHNAWTLTAGNAADHMETAALLEQIDADLVEAYVAKAGDGQDWAGMMAAETWMNAARAVEVGLVDRVAERAVKASAMAFDVSAYANAPKAEPENALVTTLIEAAPLANAIAAALKEDPEFERRRQMARLALATAA